MRWNSHNDKVEDVIADVRREVDFVRSARRDVRLYEPIPKPPHVLAFFAAGDDLPAGSMQRHLVVMFAVPCGVHREFEQFEAVILQEEGHECWAGPRRRRIVGKYV